MVADGPCQYGRAPDCDLMGDVVPAFSGVGMKRAARQEQAVPANGCCTAAIGVVIASNPARGGGGRAAWCAATAKDLDDDHPPAAARARRAMITRGIRIG